VLSYSRENRRAEFFSGMESKHVTAVDRMAQLYMRTFLRNNNPPFADQCAKNDSRLRTAPFAQAGMWRTQIESGMSFECSTSSAIAYRASAYAFAFASSTVAPYANAPGTSGISAIQRPSVSRSTSNWNRKSRFLGSSWSLIRIGCALNKRVARDEGHGHNKRKNTAHFHAIPANCRIP
jgi:hypothetical protein